MSRFNYSEPCPEDKPTPIPDPKFTTGDTIEGETDEGQQIIGRISAIGETTYRVESYGRAYTIRMSQAKAVVEEKSSEDT